MTFPLGWMYWVLIPVGIGLSFLQDWNVTAGFDRCWDDPTAGLDAPERIGLLFAGGVRFLGYPVVLLLLALPTRMLTRRQAPIRWRAIAILGALIAAAALFWIDYANTNMLSEASTTARCPSGHRPWWPSWLPV